MQYEHPRVKKQFVGSKISIFWSVNSIPVYSIPDYFPCLNSFVFESCNVPVNNIVVMSRRSIRLCSEINATRGVLQLLPSLLHKQQVSHLLCRSRLNINLQISTEYSATLSENTGNTYCKIFFLLIFCMLSTIINCLQLLNTSCLKPLNKISWGAIRKSRWLPENESEGKIFLRTVEIN